MRRKAVRLTEEHKKRYRELADKDVIITQAVLTVKREFNLPIEHNRQAVKRWAGEEGIKFRRGRRGESPLKPRHATLELTEDMIVETMIGALEAKKKLPVVEAELEKYKRGYKNLLQVKQAQEIYEKKQADRDKRLKVAQQQGSVYGE